MNLVQLLPAETGRNSLVVFQWIVREAHLVSRWVD